MCNDNLIYLEQGCRTGFALLELRFEKLLAANF